MTADETVEFEVRRELHRLESGYRGALDRLLPLLSDDLRRLARQQRRRGNSGETLRTTALINEAYLKLRASHRLVSVDRQHFLHTAALAMRHILIDHARSRLAAQRREQDAAVDDAQAPAALYRQAQRVIDIDAALSELEASNPRWAQIVNYRYFAGYSEREVAELLGVSERTVRRDWHQARAWLALALDGRDTP
ncbi:MAG TPA: ECF-type sigma factor [Rhodanobacteraceae bacterium]|nr:ECF-type sigma factor [Rhodanobacteraceae bacterium]